MSVLVLVSVGVGGTWVFVAAGLGAPWVATSTVVEVGATVAVGDDSAGSACGRCVGAVVAGTMAVFVAGGTGRVDWVSDGGSSAGVVAVGGFMTLAKVAVGTVVPVVDSMSA
ncbi:MAG TPA: hypothetical protein VLQ48_09855 [Chloroflexia bacterium]|nr:hypothetical protein [Chloroflexia bacterium]